MALVILLLLLLFAVTALVVVAAYGTVVATYWFELRHNHTEPPDLPAMR